MSTVPSRFARAGARSIASAPAAAGFRPAAAALAVAAAFALHPAYAQPSGGQAVLGSFTTQTQGNTFIVNTANGAGNRSVINWQSFGVPAGTITDFRQPSATSTSINRVTGGVRSDIFGTLKSNGTLVLVNPSGIAFGPGSSVDTAGFTASTLGLSEEDAIAGRLLFQGGASTLNVGEGAQILARHGDVVLVGSQVQVDRNAVVQANGAAILAAGEKVEITGRGLEGIRLEVQAGNEAVNLGALQGDAVGIFAGTLRHSGLVQAQAAASEGGKVVLKAVAGDALVDGTVTAAAQDGQGGRIDVLGERVALLAGATLDASGANGGGVIRIGGDFQGNNPDLPNAKAVVMDAGASLRADATSRGDGGRVIVWSDRLTRMRGQISARGGAAGGNGGFAEVSGRQRLEYEGMVDLRAPRGGLGTLLLDPEDLTIVHSASPTSSNTFPSTNPNPPGGALFEPSSTGPVQLTDTQLNNQLAVSNVLVKTSSPVSTGTGGQITVNADAVVSWTRASQLSLDADKGITVDGTINGFNDASALTMLARNGNIVLSSSANVSAGTIKLEAHGTGAGNIDTSAVNVFAPRDITYLADGAIAFGGIRSGQSLTSSDGMGTSAGTITLTAGSNVSGSFIAAYGDYRSGGDGGNGGDVNVTAGGSISLRSIAAQGGASYELPSSTLPPVPPGNAGHGGKVTLKANGGSLTANEITAFGGDSAGGSLPSGAAGAAGSIDAFGQAGVGIESMNVSGGYGATGTAAGSVSVTSGGTFTFSDIKAVGGSSNSTSAAGRGGTVTVDVQGNIDMRQVNSQEAIDADGGSGRNGPGGKGGSISLKAGGALLSNPSIVCDCPAPPSTGGYNSVTASGGAGDTDTAGAGTAGGAGGTISIQTGAPLVIDGTILLFARGGDGGDATSAGSGAGGAGGSGGSVTLQSPGSVTLRTPVVSAGAGTGGTAGDGVTTAPSGAIGSFAALGPLVQVDANVSIDANWSNDTLVKLSASGRAAVTGNFQNQAAGQVELENGASLVSLRDFINAGRLAVKSGASAVAGAGTTGASMHNTTTGVIDVAAGASLTAPGFLLNDGTVHVDGRLVAMEVPPPAPPTLATAAALTGTVFTNSASGLLSGTGTIAVSDSTSTSGMGTIDNFGSIAPAGSGALGTLSLGANLVMESGSALVVDLLNAASVDKLVVAGAATTGGSVAVSYLPGASFAAGDQFHVLQAGSVDATTMPTVNKTELHPQASATELLLAATAAYAPVPAPTSAPVGGAQIDTQQLQGQVVTFANQFTQALEQQQRDEANQRRIGRDDIVVTDTSCR